MARVLLGTDAVILLKDQSMKTSLVQSASLVVGVWLVACAQAQIADKRETPQLTAVRAARLIDVRTGNTIPDAVVLIEGDRFKGVGSNLAIPSSAQTIDLGNVTLLPGLVDAHTHLLHQYYRELGDDNANRILEAAQVGRARVCPHQRSRRGTARSSSGHL
jgi:predicted amidohydrolase